MLIAAVSDTHGYHNHLELPQADVFIYAGDFSQRGNLVELQSFNYWLSLVPCKYKIVIAGNHDRFVQRNSSVARATITNATYLENSSVTLDGIKFYGSPYTPLFYDWAFMLERGEPLRQIWAKIPEDTDILITHGPPKDHLDENIHGEKCGCEELLDRILRLQLQAHIFGHIHEQGGCRTSINLPTGNNVMLYNVSMSPIVPSCTLLEVFPREH